MSNERVCGECGRHLAKTSQVDIARLRLAYVDSDCEIGSLERIRASFEDESSASGK